VKPTTEDTEDTEVGQLEDELPEGWAWTTIGKCFSEIRNGTTEQQNSAGAGVPVSRIESIQRAAFDLKRVGHIQTPSKKLLATFCYLPGDIAFSHINSYEHVGKTAIYAGRPAPFIHGMNLLRLRLGHSYVDPYYLYTYMQSLAFREDVRTRVNRAVNQVSINQKQLSQIRLPIAPLAEQKRIVAKVEELLARVSAARARLARVPAILKRLRQSILAAACSGRLTEEWRMANAGAESASQTLTRMKAAATPIKTRRGVPDAVPMSEAADQFDLPDSWAKESVAELLKCGGLLDVKDGNHGANHPKRDDFTTEGLPFITAAQVSNYSIDYDGAPKVAGKALECLRVGFAQVNDAVLTHKGTVGRAALNLRPCVLTPQTTYYRCNAELLLPHYLVYFMTSAQLYQQMAAVMSQTTRDFVPISEQYNMFIFLPPLKEQSEIVRRVEALFRLADEVEKRAAAATARADRLTQAILAKAFRGELVPTEAELARREGRGFESGEELLAKTQANAQ